MPKQREYDQVRREQLIGAGLCPSCKRKTGRTVTCRACLNARAALARAAQEELWDLIGDTVYDLTVPK